LYSLLEHLGKHPLLLLVLLGNQAPHALQLLGHVAVLGLDLLRALQAPLRVLEVAQGGLRGGAAEQGLLIVNVIKR
jgi:hypothetical protein